MEPLESDGPPRGYPESLGATTTRYTTLHIDRSFPDFIHLAKQFRALRLYGLLHFPNAFSSTFAIESAWPLEFWATRLARPRTEYFVAIAHLPDAEDDWIGQVTLVGPLSEAAYALPPEAQQPMVENENEETRWQTTLSILQTNTAGKA